VSINHVDWSQHQNRYIMLPACHANVCWFWLWWKSVCLWKLLDDWLRNVQEELIGRLSVADKLWLFTHVPLSIIKSAGCRSSLMHQLTDECCRVIGKCSDSTATYTVAQLGHLVCIVFHCNVAFQAQSVYCHSQMQIDVSYYENWSFKQILSVSLTCVLNVWLIMWIM